MDWKARAKEGTSLSLSLSLQFDSPLFPASDIIAEKYARGGGDLFGGAYNAVYDTPYIRCCGIFLAKVKKNTCQACGNNTHRDGAAPWHVRVLCERVIFFILIIVHTGCAQTAISFFRRVEGPPSGMCSMGIMQFVEI